MGLRLVGNEHHRQCDAGTVSVRDIETEARRRLAALGYDRHLARQRATGADMPTTIKVKHLQIMAIAMAMAALETIPVDYRSDVYWPA